MIEIHDVLDSTSAEAQRLAATGRKAPFAVLARMQTAGRGRRGRGWSSTPGNLMLTVAIPSATWSKGPAIESAPIRAAILIARFIRQTFGLRVTLKWPNDILFAGRKLGGILCETSTFGSSVGDLLVGVGINVVTAPELSGPDAVVTTSLSEILGPQNSRLPEVHVIARELAAYLASQWDTIEDLTEAFESFAIQQGNILLTSTPEPSLDESGRDPVVVRGIDDTGALLVESIRSGTQTRLSSADQSRRWLFQEIPESAAGRLMVADIGNSRIKVSLWEHAHDAKAAFQQSFSPEEMAAVPTMDVLTRLVSGSRDVPLVCHAISVNQDNFAIFARAAAAAGIHVLPVVKRPVKLRTAYDWNAIGIDRVAAMEAFLSRLDARSRGDENGMGIVVCAGTATTIDAVSFAGRHFGGIIIPGVATGLRALHEAAPALPDLSLESANIASASGPGMSTGGAILGGSLAMTAGAIQMLAESALRSAANGKAPEGSSSVRVVFTGGHGVSLMRGFKDLASLPCDLEVVENLTSEGARVMARGG